MKELARTVTGKKIEEKFDKTEEVIAEAHCMSQHGTGMGVEHGKVIPKCRIIVSHQENEISRNAGGGARWGI